MPIQFALIVACFNFILNLILFCRYIVPLHWGIKKNLMVGVGGIFLSFCPVWASDFFLPFYGSHAFFIQQSCYAALIASCLLITFTVIADGIHFLIHFFPVNYPHQLITKAVIGLTILCTLWAVYEGNKTPPVRFIEISSPQIHQAKTIAVLTDLHISQTLPASKIEKIVERTNDLHPDVIVLVGDIIDDRALEKIAPKVQLLKKLQAPLGVYYVTGNHEFYVGYPQAVEMIRSNGITPLEHAGRLVAADLYIGGIPDYKMYERMGHQVHLTDIFPVSEAYKILLSHTPTDFDAPVFDLEISGHTHGGQIFPFHFFSWLVNHGFLSGFYDLKNGGRIYVSNGAGQWGPQLRFLAESELTFIRLQPALVSKD